MTAALRLPGPKGSLLAGNLPEFRRGRLEFFTRCAREFGDFVGIRFGPRRIILVSDPDAIEFIVVGGSRFFGKHFALRLNPLLLGNGLLASDGEFWRRQRRMAQPAFKPQRIDAYADVMVRFTRQLLDEWQPGRQVDIHAEMQRLTLRIAAKTLFDADVADEAREVGKALRLVMENFVARFQSTFPLPASWPTPQNLRLRRAVRRLDQIIYGFIHRRRADGTDRGDLLSLLLQAQAEDGDRMTDKQLRDEAMTLFLAGHETTALCLAWTWYALAKAPQVQARLAAEVDEVLGGRPPTVTDLPRLRYADWIIQESMRLYPPAYVIGREALEDVTVAGRRFPKGMTFFMSQWVMQRDPRFYRDPEEFQPERWADEEVARRPKFSYFPFGGGPRLCIGNTFAMMEMVLALATIAQNYRFTVLRTVTPYASFTLQPDGGIPAVLERR